MIKGIIDSYELWQSRPENLNENMEDPIESAENRGWNQCNRSWIKTIEEQPRVGEWIPCSERLPEAEDLYEVAYPKLKQYLVQNKNGDMTVVHYIILSNKPCFESGSAVINDVIAWMPLPEAYKEADNAID